MEIRTIAVLTSGSDAPGMNSAIRAVTRSAIFNGLKVKAVRRGYKGLIDGDVVEFETQHVSNIVQMGGTILKSSPSRDFYEAEGRHRAYEVLQREQIDALVCIGGDGTIHGARVFANEYDVPCITIPATIDNNILGTDTTIGYDTALNTIMECVDKIRDTATSHERLFFVEVLGDDAGFLAVNGALASGCEDAILPHGVGMDGGEVDLEQMLGGFRKTKSSSIVLVAAAEDESEGGALRYAEMVKDAHKDLDVRISILGHLQRGGRPSAHDRIIASRMGVAAIEALKKGLRNVMVGIERDEIVYVPFSRAVRAKREIDGSLVEMLHRVSC